MAPSLNTAEAFWKIVIQNKVNLIIQLCPDEENDKEMCVNYYDPTKTLETDFLKFGDVTVRLSQKKGEIHRSIHQKALDISAN